MIFFITNVFLIRMVNLNGYNYFDKFIGDLKQKVKMLIGSYFFSEIYFIFCVWQH